MIDLHCHILPGLDDGAADLQTALDMAQAFVADGVSVVACTPHILPGLYPNTGPNIRHQINALQNLLDHHGIALTLVSGADNHITGNFVEGLRSGHLLTLADTRYVLVEPPHHVAPPRLEEFFFDLQVAGFVPVLTHPERLTWLKSHYEAVCRMVDAGVWVQLTAGSLAGAFGRSALYWSHRLLDEGRAHIIATDAHDIAKRPPDLARGRDLVARRVGDAEAQHMVLTRPAGVLRNLTPDLMPPPSGPSGVAGRRDGAGHGNEYGQMHERPRGGGLRDLAQRLRRLIG